MASQLVPLPEVERLSKTCIRILGGNPGKFTLQGTNTYLLGTGEKRLLIDTAQGMPSWKLAVQKVLEEEKATIQACLITHWHGDHTTGILDLQSFSPATAIYKAEPGGEQEEITDGQRFSVEGATLTAIHSPGHTTDHMAFLLDEEDAMLTGDNVLGQGTAVFEDLFTYLDSLDKMGSLFRGRAYPGHGPVIADGPAKIAEYRAHRKQREDQVFNTLQGENVGGEGKGGGWSSMDLVKVIYSDVRKDLHEAAERGVLQILHKLEKDGKVSRSPGGLWVPTGRSSL
ncbi:putative metallo-beta-lactamase domain protein [Zalerion maritima]|uniref:Metallo-beta-lactamase domain protein n=1 Tax=Zalerion maritima TaxID=339359 RepID=A0AAD5WQA5_9PEZI|nr:putative metallo-beta-lactamase domain protein [Zalerion maritima]